MLRLFGFDGDGCAYDTIEHASQATYSAASSLKENPTIKDIKAAFSAGLPLADVFKRAAPNSDPNEMVARFYEFDTRQGYDRITTFPHTLDVLTLLRAQGIQNVLITNRNRASTLAIIAKTGLSVCLDDIITSDDVTLHKPNPEGIDRAMLTANATNLETTYMGDTSGDIKTGKNGLVRATFGFTRGFGSAKQLQKAGADLLIEDWAQIPIAISSL